MQRKMQLRSFIKYLRNNKGFVTINSRLYRQGYFCGEFTKTLTTYHVDDIGYKYARYRNGEKLSRDTLNVILSALDVANLPEKERAIVMSAHDKLEEMHGN